MTKDLIKRITYHLSSGGLFNPELADHLAVRNLLMECREALAQPEQEHVALRSAVSTVLEGFTLPQDVRKILETAYFNTTPPQRKPLTDEEVNKLVDDEDWYNDPHGFVRVIEAAHGIKVEA